MNDFVLYILMRKDMDSLNHMGKAIAQGAHAANHAAALIGSGAFGPRAMTDFRVWEKETAQGFGTVIVLGGVYDHQVGVGIRLSDIKAVVEMAAAVGIAAGVTHDPSYPLQDGNVVHAFPCDTCGWLFGSKTQLAPLLKDFILHPNGVSFLK
jgi:hypothetical protein